MCVLSSCAFWISDVELGSDDSCGACSMMMMMMMCVCTCVSVEGVRGSVDYSR